MSALDRISSPWDAEIFALALPALLTTLLDPIMGMIDTAIVGRLGTASLAAVGLSTVVYNFSNFIWNFLLYTTTPRVAAAASQDDLKGVSAITSQGLWVAMTIGVTMMMVLFTACPLLFAKMGATPEVMEYAVPFLRVRCLASPAIMMSYVMSGTFRGFKDTTATLKSSMWSNVVHLVLDVVLVFWMGLGAVGAAVATTASLWLNFGMLFSNILKKEYLLIQDMKSYPSFTDVAPMLRNGLFLSTRSILAMTTLMVATKFCAGLGAAALGAHEIIRQIWVVSNQAFTSLDIATQSLVAFYLGRSDKESASAVFKRTLSLTLVAGIIILSCLFHFRHNIATLFTSDASVISLVSLCMPLIAIFMPLDGAASVMDGVLLGSQQAAWMSKTMVLTSICCSVALFLCHLQPHTTILSIWGAIKLLTVGRLIGNAWRVFSPSDSPLGQNWWAHV